MPTPRLSRSGRAAELLLRRGSACAGTLALTGSGSTARPALVGAYGRGPRPLIGASGEDGVRLENVSHVTVEDIEVINPGDGTAKKRGVHLVAAGETVAGVTVRDLHVHDVGGNLDKDTGGSGGIQVDSTGPGVGRFRHLVIEDNRIEDVSRSGIFVVGVAGGERPRASEPWPEASSGVRIRRNEIRRIAGDGIVALGTDGARVRRNLVRRGNRAGRGLADPEGMICNAGIWAFHANNTVIERNEVAGMRFNGCDGSGFDIDYDQDGTVVQFNYSHDNEGGFMLLCTDTEPRSAAVRFNLSVNDGFSFNSSPCSRPAGTYEGLRIYNNTIVGPDPGVATLGYRPRRSTARRGSTSSATPSSRPRPAAPSSARPAAAATSTSECRPRARSRSRRGRGSGRTAPTTPARRPPPSSCGRARRRSASPPGSRRARRGTSSATGSRTAARPTSGSSRRAEGRLPLRGGSRPTGSGRPLARPREESARWVSHRCGWLRDRAGERANHQEGAMAVKQKRKSNGTKLSGREREDAILALIRAVPEGFVTTYGDLCPEAPRLPGRVLATTSEKLPWHRIVRADGTFVKGERQRLLLRKEGIPFVGKRVDLERAHIPREALLDRI